jgi:hypothetical protein
MKETGQRQIDLADLLHVKGIAEAAQTDNILFVQRLFHLGCEPGPGLPVQLNERGNTFAVRFVALHCHYRDSAPHAAESEMRQLQISLRLPISLSPCVESWDM